MSKYNKFLWIISSILLMVCGIVCLIVPETGYTALTYIVGAVILIIGGFELYGYFKYGVGFLGGGWMLVYSIITIIFGMFLLMNQAIVASVLPFICGIWIISMGVSRIVASFDIRFMGIASWWSELLTGILDIIIGIIFTIEPIQASVTIGVVMGIMLLVSGASMMNDACYISRMKKYTKKFVNEDVVETIDGDDKSN